MAEMHRADYLIQVKEQLKQDRFRPGKSEIFAVSKNFYSHAYEIQGFLKIGGTHAGYFSLTFVCTQGEKPGKLNLEYVINHQLGYKDYKLEMIGDESSVRLYLDIAQPGEYGLKIIGY